MARSSSAQPHADAVHSNEYEQKTTSHARAMSPILERPLSTILAAQHLQQAQVSPDAQDVDGIFEVPPADQQLTVFGDRIAVPKPHARLATGPISGHLVFCGATVRHV